LANEMRLYCMCSAFLEFDQSVFSHGRGMGQRVRVPSLMFLIDHPAGRVLFETGLDPAVVVDPIGYLGRAGEDLNPEMSPDQAIIPQLRSLGYEAADINFVVLSCLYFDHAGGLKHFPHATVVVQREEVEEAWWPTTGRRAIVNEAYCMKDLTPTRTFRFLYPESDEHDIFTDGRVVVLRAPCHSRGEQAVVVRLPKTGTVLLPAGVIPQEQNFAEDVLTGRLLVSPDEAVRSVNKLKRLAEDEQATLFFHHDATAWQTYRFAPAFYE
jgi:N-acyl homoserine lactone hydrolase